MLRQIVLSGRNLILQSMEGKKKICVSMCKSTSLSNASSYLLGHCFEGSISVKTCLAAADSTEMMNMEHWWNQG
jgi:methylaspartate ammonia-lyase